ATTGSAAAEVPAPARTEAAASGPTTGVGYPAQPGQPQTAAPARIRTHHRRGRGWNFNTGAGTLGC
ncbi:hypothetical protein OSJ12_25475, partial [Mycobacterium ulcerans]